MKIKPSTHIRSTFQTGCSFINLMCQDSLRLIVISYDFRRKNKTVMIIIQTKESIWQVVRAAFSLRSPFSFTVMFTATNFCTKIALRRKFNEINVQFGSNFDKEERLESSNIIVKRDYREERLWYIL